MPFAPLRSLGQQRILLRVAGKKAAVTVQVQCDEAFVTGAIMALLAIPCRWSWQYLVLGAVGATLLWLRVAALILRAAKTNGEDRSGLASAAWAWEVEQPLGAATLV